MEKIKISSKGFTLLELLVVVLIIGILASIALPQYQMAVTKAKVASILPLMRRWKDALYEYKLQHGSYYFGYDASALGVSWPSDWTAGEDDGSCQIGDRYCYNDYWDCMANTSNNGLVSCLVGSHFGIFMYARDYPDCEVCRDKIICQAYDTEGHKVCKALGGKLIDDNYKYQL